MTFVLTRDQTCTCIYVHVNGPAAVIQLFLPSVSMTVDGELYTPVPALFTAATSME